MISENLSPDSLVAITKADDYSYAKVYKAVEKCLELIGGLDRIVWRGGNVFVKINHLPPASTPERAIVTHPVLVKAVVEILKTAGANITVGDDIGTEPMGVRDAEEVDAFQVSGIRQVCQESKVKLINLREAGFVKAGGNGLLLDEVYISKVALNADVIINLPKLKTHSLTTYTGGIKNMFGTTPKGKRVQYHKQYNRIEDFNQMLIDVFSAVKPHLTIMDGIVAMEGAGPSAGSPRKLGVILASRDTVALDTVATRIIGLEPLNFLMTKYAYERGLGTGNLQRIDIVGENIDNVAVTDFKLPAPRPIGLRHNAPAFISPFLDVFFTFVNKQNVIKPRVIKRLCIGCFECKKTCPVNAIMIVGDKVSVNKSICISCFCCHEVCRSNAILLRRTLHGRLIVFVARRLISFASRVLKIIGVKH